MYRIRVTTLEKFRRVQLGLTSFDTDEALLESMKGIFMGNEKTFIGEAYHALIEGDFASGKSHFLAKGILFTPEQAKAAFDYKKNHQLMTHEVSVQKQYTSRGHNILLSGKIDGIEGLEVADQKLKFGEIDYLEYMDSHQWRYYLDMMELNTFYYNIIQVEGFDGIKGEKPYLLPGVTFIPPDPLRCDRYNDLHLDCQILLDEFMDYVSHNNLFHLLKTVNEPAIFRH